MHKELFLRKRKKQVGKAATNLLDFDFNLGTISESDSSGDEMFLVPANKDLAKSMKSKFTYSFTQFLNEDFFFHFVDGGIANGGFVPDYSVVDETTDYSKTVIKRDFDKGKLKVPTVRIAF